MDQPQLWKLVHPRLIQSRLDSFLIADFCHSGIGSVHRWCKNQSPTGSRLIRLWYLLEQEGQAAPEVSQLPQLQMYVRELHSLNIISISEVCEIFNLKQEQSALRALRGHDVLKPIVDLEELTALYEERVASERLLLAGRVGLSLSEYTGATDVKSVAKASLVSKPAEQPRSVEVVTAVTTVLAEPLLVSIASQLGAVLPRLTWLNSEECRPELRSQLRDLLGLENMFALLNAVHGLNSERARTEGMQR